MGYLVTRTLNRALIPRQDLLRPVVVLGVLAMIEDGADGKPGCQASDPACVISMEVSDQERVDCPDSGCTGRLRDPAGVAGIIPPGID